MSKNNFVCFMVRLQLTSIAGSEEQAEGPGCGQATWKSPENRMKAYFDEEYNAAGKELDDL
jgi:hypothetical protein